MSKNEVDDKSPAGIAKEQYQYYQDTFVPVERAFKGLIKSPEEIESRSKNAGIAAAKASNSEEGQLKRNLGRYGMQLDPTQQKEVDLKFDMGEAGAVAGAQTRTRGGLYDMNLHRQGEFVGLGRNLATSSLNSLNTAASNEMQRNAANDQAKAQNNAGKVQLATTLGIAAAVVF